MSPAELALSESAILDAALKGSPKLGGVLGGIALFSTANTVLIGLVTISRIIYGISKDRFLPPFLSKLMHKQQTPWAAALLAMIASVLLLLILLSYALGKLSLLKSVPFVFLYQLRIFQSFRS